MHKVKLDNLSGWIWPAIVGEVILLAVLGYMIYDLRTQRAELEVAVGGLEEELSTTQNALAIAENEKTQLYEALNNEQAKLDSVSDAFEDIKDTVDVLDRLSKLDAELLQKYSKVYFLNEHYVPENLADIDTDYLYNEQDEEKIDKRVLKYLEDLLEDAQDDDIELYVASAYRSFDTQASLKSNYTVTYGSGANTFSADQGYSEHQLGTTVDFLTTGINGTLSGFGGTEAYQWLLDNAHKYGFTLSYPEGNAFYIFEPWHWRFVGEDLARDLHKDDRHFYDMPQRAIDEYLIDIFE